jgi:hypothetical protein
MWFLLVVGLDIASVAFVGATARTGRAVLPALHVALALVMIVMALFGGIPHGRALLPILLILAAATALIRRGRCSAPTCWHLIACAVGMGVLVLQMPATHAPAMAGMSMASSMSMGGTSSLIGWTVLAIFFVVSAFQAAALVERRPTPLGGTGSLALEQLALLTGSLAMVAMAAGMLAGAPTPFST